MCIFAGTNISYLYFMKRMKDLIPYERPRTTVVELQQASSLLQSSGGNGSLGGFRNLGGTPWTGGSASGGSPLGGWTNSGENPWK